MSWSSEVIYATALVEFIAIAVHLLVIGSVLLSRRREPSATLAWILFIIVAPIVGVIFYFLVGRTRMRRRVRRLGRVDARLRKVLERYDFGKKAGCENLDPRTKAQIRLGNALASTAASSGNRVRVLVDAADTYQEMMQAIAGATSYVHIEFYIIKPDAVGLALRDGLVNLAKLGVSVRVICDALGSVDLPTEFWNPLRDAGGKAAFFAPLTKMRLRIRRRDRVDFRNHRKIVIVDGRVGFTGGINVGKEYLGLDPNVGNWRDTHVRIEGPAVLSLQQAFVHDWLLTTGEALDDEGFFEMGPPVGDCPVQVIDSGPDRTWASMELYYAQAIAFAQQRVWITNPYFIPSQTIESMLVQAALRGVDVRLLLPKKSDSHLVTWASHSYYRYLLFAGVRIFEYDRGFVHAKTMVVDDWVATIGSANMDLRSFKLNFELNAFLFDSGICQTLASHFETDLERALEVTKAMERRVSLGRRLLRGIARLTSPLL
jgi:cardiolipin synthase